MTKQEIAQFLENEAQTEVAYVDKIRSAGISIEQFNLRQAKWREAIRLIKTHPGENLFARVKNRLLRQRSPDAAATPATSAPAPAGDSQPG